jgi:3-oxoacyl-[acyl-carrier protein] reductase
MNGQLNHQLFLSSLEKIKYLANSGQDTFGGITVVVNCAGIMPLSPIARGDLDLFDKVIATNLRGTFVVLRQATCC